MICNAVIWYWKGTIIPGTRPSGVICYGVVWLWPGAQIIEYLQGKDISKYQSNTRLWQNLNNSKFIKTCVVCKPIDFFDYCGIAIAWLVQRNTGLQMYSKDQPVWPADLYKLVCKCFQHLKTRDSVKNL